jgi:hypothetical protein
MKTYKTKNRVISCEVIPYTYIKNHYQHNLVITDEKDPKRRYAGIALINKKKKLDPYIFFESYELAYNSGIHRVDWENIIRVLAEQKEKTTV